MEALRLYQIDAFTRERFMGNPAGVVTNAAGLDERQMLLIARELNNIDPTPRPSAAGRRIHH